MYVCMYVCLYKKEMRKEEGGVRGNDHQIISSNIQTNMKHRNNVRYPISISRSTYLSIGLLSIVGDYCEWAPATRIDRNKNNKTFYNI